VAFPNVIMLLTAILLIDCQPCRFPIGFGHLFAESETANGKNQRPKKNAVSGASHRLTHRFFIKKIVEMKIRAEIEIKNFSPLECSFRHKFETDFYFRVKGSLKGDR
jgi:hypothetical protein